MNRLKNVLMLFVCSASSVTGRTRVFHHGSHEYLTGTMRFDYDQLARTWDEEVAKVASLEKITTNCKDVKKSQFAEIVQGPKIIIPSSQQDQPALNITTQRSNNVVSTTFHKKRIYCDFLNNRDDVQLIYNRIF